MTKFKKYNEFINEMSIPTGKWVNIDMSKLDKEAEDLIWNMYTETYSKEGLDFSADDAHELKTKYKATYLKDVDSDHKPDAFIIYKETVYGNKIALLGTNEKKGAKRESKRMEEILVDSKVPVVDDFEVIQNIVGKHKQPQMEEDGYYSRFLSKAGKRITKRIYGKLK
jgi:hypothetical protein